MKLTTRLLQVRILRIGGAIPLLSLYAYVARTRKTLYSYLFFLRLFSLVRFHRSFFVYLAPFLALSYISSLYLPFYLLFISPYLYLYPVFFCCSIPLVMFLLFPFCLLFVAFYEWSFHLTTSESVIILNGKKHAHNLLHCLLRVTPGSSLEIYRRFRGT